MKLSDQSIFLICFPCFILALMTSSIIHYSYMQNALLLWPLTRLWVRVACRFACPWYFLLTIKTMLLLMLYCLLTFCLEFILSSLFSSTRLITFEQASRSFPFPPLSSLFPQSSSKK